MQMNDAKMYDRVLASDTSCNGRFFFGVTTTGIYCLPSCGTRKPKRENIRFFPSCESARDSGFRPCRKCHPDDFARGADPVLETIESLVSEMCASPQNFPGIAAVVRRSGFGTTRVFELFRQYYHATPADVLLRARLDAAKHTLITTDTPLLDVASQAGFESQSAFHKRFHEFNGLTPAAYRTLARLNTQEAGMDRSAKTVATSAENGMKTAYVFKLTLSEKYSFSHMLRTFGRDPQSVSERMSGDTYTTGVRLADLPALVTLRFAPPKVEVRISTAWDWNAADANMNEKANGIGSRARQHFVATAHDMVCGLLGLGQDSEGFARLARGLGFARLVIGREELRVSQTPTVFDGLAWAIIGQQINLPFAFLLRRRLIERAGERIGDSGLYAPPTPQAVAKLEPPDLLALQFSRQKADYLIGVARMIASGTIDIEELRRASATRAERILSDVRGLGLWSVNYIMMRSLGFADCVPCGDTGLATGLQKLFKLDAKPDIDATKQLMRVFAPQRTLATAHLWQLMQPVQPQALATASVVNATPSATASRSRHSFSKNTTANQII